MNDNSYRHWKTVTDAEGLLWLHFDKQDSATNTLSVEVIEELEQILEHIESGHPPLGLVFVSDKKSGFIAGADIESFVGLRDREQALAFIQRGQNLMDRIERLPCPSVALIHGFCLGGGLELALACTYRIIDDGDKTQLGLPEIQLGIHPGFGGSVRLTRLIGAPAAMDLMLTGRSVRAKAAKRMGIVDYAVPTRQLITSARQVILEKARRHRPSRLQRLSNNFLVRPVLAQLMRKQVAKKARKDHYPAPYALIDLWQRHGDSTRGMMEAEAKSVAKLVMGDTAQNLVRVFFLRDRLKHVGKEDKAIKSDFKHVHVIGAGVMGGDIAAWCALRGLQVTVQDRNPATLAKALARADKLFKKKLKEPRAVTAARDRLTPDVQGLGVPKADVIIEAIIEDIEAKQSLYKTLEPQMKTDALLTTNTSSIPLEVLGEALEKPGRLVGLHFFNPVAQMPLIEIVSGRDTNATDAARAAAFAHRIGRLPLPVKSSPGFLVNRILMPYMMEAVRMREEGVPAASIDKAALNFGMPMGPLRLADTVGLDICLSVADILGRELGLTVPASLREMVEKGALGVKSGHGFYAYDKGGKKLPDHGKTAGKASGELTERLIARMLNEAVACLREGVVENEELLDAGVIFGTGFAPFRGGPMHYAESRGIQTYMETLRSLEEHHGVFFKPDDGWGRLAT